MAIESIISGGWYNHTQLEYMVTGCVNMSSLILSLLLFLCASQSASSECKMMHSLQQCAAAISNNEPFQVQQEKCSPAGGCNYDCPTSQKVIDLEDTFRKNVTNLEAKIQQIMSLINITSNITNDLMQIKQGIATIEQNIAINGLDITSNEESITINVHNISVLSDEVDSLKSLHYHSVCGSTGWTRIAFLDMPDSAKDCPSELRLYESGSVRACGRLSSGGGSCSSITFTPHDIEYSEVCGKLIGYQYSSADAVDHTISDQHSNIDSYYVDGVSLTRGSPRQHIWTFMAAYSEQNIATYHCPCNTGSSVSLQSFIGDDYFCESGNPESNTQAKLYIDDPLWDGEGCGGQEGPCCTHDTIPWFHKVFESATNDYIELRVCSDQGTANEDTTVSMYEIYIK